MFASQYRFDRGIPGHTNIEPTAEDNDAWTKEGWTFAIKPLTLSYPDASEPEARGNDERRYDELED